MQNNSTNRLPILVLTSTFPRWENDPEPPFVFELSRRLGASFDVTVLAPRSPGSKMLENMDNLHVIRFPYFFRRWENLATHSGGILSRLHSNPLNFLLVPFFLLGQLLALVRLLRQQRFALIHAHWLLPQGMLAVMALALSHRKILLVCTSHGGDLFALRGKFFQRLKRWVVDKSKVVSVVSQVMQNTVINMGVTPDKVKVISMGVDLQNRFIPDHAVKRNPGEILFVGRLVEKKGVRILIEAMPAVLAMYPSACLSVAGAGPLETNLRQLVRQLNISDSVHFLGMVAQSQLPQLYQRSALAVFPFVVAKNGDQEGFGLVQVEAMGCECPIIASDLPVIHDIITHGENGFLVPTGKSEFLAQTIIKLLSNPDLGHKLAREARKRVMGFDWEIVAEKYANLYRMSSEENGVSSGTHCGQSACCNNSSGIEYQRIKPE